MNGDGDGIHRRVTKQGEEAIGKFAQDLLKSPLVTGTLTDHSTASRNGWPGTDATNHCCNAPPGTLEIPGWIPKVKCSSPRLLRH